MLKRVSDLPDRKGPGGRESYVARDVREFCRNRTYDVAELTYGGKAAKNVCSLVRQYIAKHPGTCKGVRVCVRDGKTYIYRDEIGS